MFSYSVQKNIYKGIVANFKLILQMFRNIFIEFACFWFISTEDLFEGTQNKLLLYYSRNLNK